MAEDRKWEVKEAGFENYWEEDFGGGMCAWSDLGTVVNGFHSFSSINLIHVNPVIYSCIDASFFKRMLRTSSFAKQKGARLAHLLFLSP